MSNFNMDRVLNRVTSSVRSLCVAQLHSHEKVTSALEKVVISFSNQPECSGDALNAINSVFGGKARAIASSFRVIPDISSSSLAMVGYVVPNFEHRRLARDELAKFTVVAKNVLVSNDDNTVWDMNTSGEDVFITRQSKEDLSDLLTLATVKDRAIPEVSSFASANPQRGEYVAFACDRTQTVRYGYVAKAAAAEGGCYVVPRDTLEVAFILDSQLVDVATMSGVDDEVLAAVNDQMPKSDDPALEDLTNYYKAVFNYSPEYWAKFEETIKSRGY